ncbi:MAG: sigma 54-interacting transcriptional regulator [Pseudomonadota bacterium]
MAQASTAHSHELEHLRGAAGLEHEQFWQMVVNTMSEGLLLINPQRQIVYMNHKAEEIIGRDCESARGATCIDAMNCPECTCVCRLFEDGNVENVEVTIIGHRDQRRRTLLKNARLLRNARGEVVGGVETFKDISHEVVQRQAAERYTAMLYEEKTRSEALLEAMGDGVFSIDGELRVRTFSPRMADILGVDEEQVRGQLLLQVLGATLPYEGVSSALELDGRSCRVEIQRAGGSRGLVDLSFRRIRLGDSEVLGLLHLVDDVEARAPRVEDGYNFHGLISRSPQMHDIFRLLESAAQSQASILVEGESGTGKELVARAIHRLCPRRDEPFHAVNCATFTGSLLLSELFGHERGAFTGAFRTTKGKLELAGNGTLFLDEVSEIPLHYQGVLLRVLEERVFERVGGQQRIEFGARIIAATNERLTEAVASGRFREDLFYRLKVVPIQVPPLRQRREDVALLANYFANHPAINLRGSPIRFSDAAMRALTEHPWPGNVRELRNLVEYLCFLGTDRIELEHLPEELRGVEQRIPTRVQGPAPHDLEIPPAATCRRGSAPDERDRVLTALRQTNFHRGQAARLLGIDRSTLWRRLRGLGISLDVEKPGSSGHSR